MPVITDDATIRQILAQLRRIAVIGLSPDSTRPSHRVAKAMMQAGYQIVPVNPNADRILGLDVYDDLKYVTGTISMVTVFRDPKHVPAIAELCIEKKVRNLWLQEGVIHHEAAREAAAHGIHVVINRCMHKEYNRLLG